MRGVHKGGTKACEATDVRGAERGSAEGGSGSVERHQHGPTSGTSPKGGARPLEEQTRPVEGDSFPLRQACSERPRLRRIPAPPGGASGPQGSTCPPSESGGVRALRAIASLVSPAI